jgi:hypothetical protein
VSASGLTYAQVEVQYFNHQSACATAINESHFFLRFGLYLFNIGYWISSDGINKHPNLAANDEAEV